MTGTAGNDSFSGGVGGTSAQNTLGITDELNGGAGSDTLTLAINGEWTGFTTGSVKSIETLNLNNAGVAGSPISFVMRNFEGVETVNATGPVNASGIAALATKVNIKTVSSAQTVTVGYDTTLVTGSSDAATVGIEAFGRAPAAVGTTPLRNLDPAATVTVQAPGIEALTLNTAGDNYIQLDATGGPRDLTINGSSTGRFVAAGTNLKTFDASANTGALDVRLQANATSVNTIKTGSGNDFIRVGNNQLLPTATIDGGAGTDRLELDGVTSAALTMTKVEEVAKRGSGNLTFSFANVKDVNKIIIAGNAVDAGTSTFTGLGTSAMAIDFAGDTATNRHTASLDTSGAITGAVTITASAAAGTSAAEPSNDSLVASNASSVTFSVPRFGNWQAANNATDIIRAERATSISIEGAGSVRGRIQGDATETLTLKSTRSDAAWDITFDDGAATTAPLKTLDITRMGDFTLTAAAAELNRLETLKIDNASVSAHTLAVSLPRINTMTIKGGVDSTTAAASSVTLGVTTAIDQSAAENGTNAPAFGHRTLANDITLNASGLRGGLTLDGSIVAGPNRTITLDVSGVVGRQGTTNATATAVNIANNANAEVLVSNNLASGTTDPASGTTYSGTIVVNANGFGGGENATLNIAGAGTAIQAATVTINANTNAGNGNLTLGAISGTTVTVNAAKAAAGADSTFTVGRITATTLTFDGSEIKSANGTGAGNPLNITVGGNTFVATINGSIQDDAFAITSTRTAQTGVKVSGDMRGGTDTLTITSSSATTAQTIDLRELKISSSSTTTITAGSGADTIYDSLGQDTIWGGAGADTIYGTGTGANTYRFGDGDTGAISSATRTVGGTSSSVTVSTAVYDPTAGDVISVAALDKIYGFKTTDLLNFNGAAGALVSGANVIRVFENNSATLATGGTNALNVVEVPIRVDGGEAAYYIRGNMSGTSFTVSDTGGDSLLFASIGGAGTTTYRGIVLVGYLGGFNETAPGAATTGITGVGS